LTFEAFTSNAHCVLPGRRQTLRLAMRVLSWVGGVVLVAVISTVAAATLRSQNEGAHVPTAAKGPAAAILLGSNPADTRSDHHLARPSPDPSPDAVAAAAPPQQAAPARPAAGPSIVIGSSQQALINRDRAAAGLGPLTWSSCLYNVAASNASRLSLQGWVQPYHTNGASVDLGCRLGNQAGENVGYWSSGVNDTQVNTMFMNSAGHRANIMGPYHYVATAWVVAANGYAYVAVEFS
jgi:uncharacterized protein YkwD